MIMYTYLFRTIMIFYNPKDSKRVQALQQSNGVCSTSVCTLFFFHIDRRNHRNNIQRTTLNSFCKTRKYGDYQYIVHRLTAVQL